MVERIPSDEVLKTMSRKQLNELAFSFTTGPSASPTEERQSRELLEQLSTALLRINYRYGDNAYSESSGTTRNKRIVGREVQFSQLAQKDWISVAISESMVHQLTYQAIDAECTEHQAQVYVLHEAGVSQKKIAELLGIKQPAVSRTLDRALQNIRYHINTKSDAYIVYLMESHRSKYHAPPFRLPLDSEIELSRRVIEAESDSTVTCIQQDALKKVEVWKRGQREAVLTYDQTINRAWRFVCLALASIAVLRKKVKIECNTLLETQP